MKISPRYILSTILMITSFNACQTMRAEPANPARPTIANTPARVFTGRMLEPQGFIQRTHDPVIAHQGDTYHVFSTGSRIPFICSKDKIDWEFCGRVLEKDSAWVREIDSSLVDLWAPDISYCNDQWHLYYAGSNFGSQNSAIGLATNVTRDPNSPDYNRGDQWNAVDPNLMIDENGETWMRKIDRETGLLDERNTTEF